MGQYITAAHVAREAGISPDMARAYIRGQYPKKEGKRKRQFFKIEQLPELVQLCQSKRRRYCRNRYNSLPLSP